MGDGFLDNLTQVDEQVEDVEGVLRQIRDLLSVQLEDEGSTAWKGGQPYRPNLHVSVPDDALKLGVPGGETVIDLKEGRVTNENLVDDGQGPRHKFDGLEKLSNQFEAQDVRFRGLYIYTDVPTKLRIEGQNQVRELDSCNYYPIPAQDFTRLRLSVGIPFEFQLVATTRWQPMAPSAVTAHMDRVGEPSSSTEDSWTDIPMSPRGLFDDHAQSYAKSTLHTVSHSTVTGTLENISGNGNAMDFRVLGRHTHDGTWYVLDEKTNVSDGDHFTYTETGSFHFLKYQYRNNTNGETVQPHAEMTAQAP